jgi:RNA polymerase sigma factor (sigma-70 family)
VTAAGTDVKQQERELHRRLLEGDDKALALLYDEYSPLVFGLALRVTQDRGAAEEIVQSVFIQVWERPEVFDPDRGTFRGWLGTIAHRRAVDVVRSQRARRGREERDFLRTPTSSVTVEDGAVATSVAERVRAAVEQLPEAQQAAIRLAYFEAKTFRQVAEVLGVPEGTAKSRLRLGLNRLATVLSAEGLMAR